VQHVHLPIAGHELASLLSHVVSPHPHCRNRPGTTLIDPPSPDNSIGCAQAISA
jgi:hypothetical protein